MTYTCNSRVCHMTTSSHTLFSLGLFIFFKVANKAQIEKAFNNTIDILFVYTCIYTYNTLIDVGILKGQ